MHIGFLLPEYPHERLPKAAGIGTSTRNLIQALVASGIKISIFTYFQDETEVIQEENITSHKIKLQKYPVLTWKLNEGIIEKYINKIIEKDKIDVLEVVDWTGISANMKFKVPLVMRLHGSDTFFCHLAEREVKKSNFKRERKAFQKADKIIAVSQFVADTTNELFKTSKKATVIPNGISIEEFQVKNATLETNTILYFGTLIRKKGLFELAEIFNLLIQKNPEAKLILLGNDAIDVHEKRSTWECLQEVFSEEAKSQVNYLGIVPYSAMQAHIAKANVCVFPSLAESFGMVTIEAMAMEKAIVNTNYPWATEIMEDGFSGYLADPKAHQEYASKINALLNDVTLAAIMAKNAREVAVTKFDIKKLAQQNIEVYQSLIKRDEI